jgi:flavin-dependent dehydrogenase
MLADGEDIGNWTQPGTASIMGTEYDVIIAGAGPAGATAAYWLGWSGRRVLILEKQRLPRYKTCGGAIPISARWSR